MSTPTPETLRALLLRLLAFRWADHGYGRFTCRSCGAAREVDYGDHNQLGAEWRETCSPNCPWQQADELAAVLDFAPPALTPEPAEAPRAGRCATCAWWGDGDDRRVDAHGIEIAPCQHPRSPVDEYPDGTFGCVLHEDR